MGDEKVWVYKSKLDAIGDAVRSKTGSSDNMTLDKIETAVEEISIGNNNVIDPPIIPIPDITVTIQGDLIMGKLLLCKAGKVVIAGQCNVLDQWSGTNTARWVHPYRSTSGTEITYIYVSSNSDGINNLQLYANVTGYISADTEEDFSLDINDTKSYEIRDIPNIDYNRTTASQRGGRIYTIQATNNNSEEVTVNSLKFTKSIKYGNNSSEVETCLLWSYFLDAPVIIGVDETKTFVINFDN